MSRVLFPFHLAEVLSGLDVGSNVCTAFKQSHYSKPLDIYTVYDTVWCSIGYICNLKHALCVFMLHMGVRKCECVCTCYM